jgi:hypothetical protein
MLRDVSTPARFVLTTLVLVGAVSLASVASAASVAQPVAIHTVHPTPAASNSTRHVAHVTGVTSVHHRHHARLHHTEPNLRAHVVTAASLPARVPSRPRVPRSNHRTPATVYSHRDTGPRTSSTTGMPVSSAGLLSLAILGTCVHQRTRDRLRSISEPLESRGPPRAGPSFATLASRSARGAREFTADASAPHPPLGGPRNSRVTPTPDHRFAPVPRAASHPAPTSASAATLERLEPLRVHATAGPGPRLHARAPRLPAARGARPACPIVPQRVSRCTGACGPTWSALSRAGALRCRSLEPEV